MRSSGNLEALAPKIPITAQSIDLPSNEEGTLMGALDAVEKREEIRKAMRRQRRASIKERNFLGSV
jgi:large subunit ribosomal protein L54